MKSLAHPAWPYTGTPHEWRGFVVTPICEAIAPQIEEILSGAQSVNAAVDEYFSIYQNLDFGPELT